MTTLKVAVAGAGGRMGRALVAAIAAHPQTTLHSAFTRPGDGTIGTDAGGLAGIDPLGVTIGDSVSDALEDADVVIDFTTPALSLDLAQRAAALGLVHIIGTTGFSAEDEEKIAEAARAGARIVKSGNMSLGVNLLAALVKKAAAALDTQFDIEILEMHHRHKVDAPSGTALLLGEAAAEGRGIALAENSVRVRDGHTGARAEGSIGFASLRGGVVVGEHAVLFAGPSETLTLSHSAQDRSLFAAGALKAALWAADKPKGHYSMADVLGLNEKD